MPASKWQLRIMTITGHGYMNYPAKDACLVYVSDIFKDGEYTKT